MSVRDRRTSWGRAVGAPASCVLATVAACVLAAAAVVPAQVRGQEGSPGGSPGAQPADLEAAVARIRAATAAFRDVEAAKAAGYPESVPPHCMESMAGGMGHHYLNPDLMDDSLVLEQPEILVYEPTPGGGLELVGVEYVVPYTAWRRDEAPRILGQDLKRSDALGIWYLHVWVWRENPRGLFADWNPAVSCSP
jgi:hypothetical protein